MQDDHDHRCQQEQAGSETHLSVRDRFSRPAEPAGQPPSQIVGPDAIRPQALASRSTLHSSMAVRQQERASHDKDDASDAACDALLRDLLQLLRPVWVLGRSKARGAESDRATGEANRVWSLNATRTYGEVV